MCTTNGATAGSAETEYLTRLQNNNKKAENKTVFSKKMVVYTKFFGQKSEKIHCDTAKPELNQRVTIDQVHL
jgi:hypothetical protein